MPISMPRRWRPAMPCPSRGSRTRPTPCNRPSHRREPMSDFTAKKSLQRRTLLKGAAAASGALAFPFVRAADPITLRYLGTAVNQDKAIADKFKADTGITIQYIPVTTDDVTKRAVTAP